MQVSQEAQELLETLWLEQEGEPPVPLSALEGSAAFNELLQLGYAGVADGRADLTDRGLREGRGAVRRHRLAERLLADVLDLGEQSLDEAGCRFEHLLYPELEDKVCALLGHPRACPHGKPIPPGPCCETGARETGKLVAPLTGLEVGEGGRVAYLQAAEGSRLRELMSIGLLPGAPVKLLRKSPAFVLSLGESEFALDEDMAKAIYVRVQTQRPPSDNGAPRERGWRGWRWGKANREVADD
ncbi:MAG: metal-dependent transcriptional regulator [Armatimonadetes bacterium]|nr:metal-dependent transcriptional regulator [Armatimonadota bacterium]